MHHQDTASADAGAERLVADRYRLLSVLGEGGMGTVWRARDEVLHREVAVKEVRAPVGLDAERVKRLYTRLEREAWAAARISARAVVTVHDVATDDGRPWIVMELVRGRSLGDVIGSQGALPPQEVARIGAEVLDALRAAHSAGVLHRDVKPANVLLADDGRVVLTDFGIAAVEGDSALTMTGEVVGSPEYLAPERALGRPCGPAADLWSLGALLYTAVEGRSPFRRTTALGTLRAVVDDELPPPHQAGPLTSVIEGLLRKEPADRITAEEAGQELRLATGARNTAAAADAPTAEEPTVSGTSATTAVDPRIPAPETGTTAVDTPTTASHPDAPTAEEPAASEAPAPTAVDPRIPAPKAGTTAVDTPTTAPHPDAPTALEPPHSGTAPAVTPDAPVVGTGPASEAVPAAVPVVPEPAGAITSAPMRRSRRTGYLIGVGAVVLALLVGGLVYALVGGDASKERVSVTVTGNATKYVGDCPPADSDAPEFTATFSVSELPVQFSYRWVSTNGSVIDKQWRTLSFREDGPSSHRETVRLSTYAQAGTLRSEMAVEIRSPFDAVSNSVPFSVTCATATDGQSDGQ